MDQPVKCLPCKYKDITSILRSHIKKNKEKKWGLVHTCDPSTEWVETRRALGLTGQTA